MTSNSANFFRAACILCGLAVVLGAFGAHALKVRLSPEMLATFEVGVRYQFYHGLALLALTLAPVRLWESPWPKRACWAWIVGIAIFSGSLYILALTGQKWLGAITPFGGVAMILGWGFAAMGARKLSE